MKGIIRKTCLSVICLTFLMMMPFLTAQAMDGGDISELRILEGEGATDYIYHGGGVLQGLKSAKLSPVEDIFFVSDKDSLPLTNSGARPVCDEAGKPVTFHEGDSTGYMVYVRKDCFQPYVSNLRVAKAGSKKEAVGKLVQEGCYFYVDEN